MPRDALACPRSPSTAMRAFAVALLVVLAGCDALGGADSGTLRTDAPAVVAAVDDAWISFSVPLTYVNETGRTAYLTGCSQPDGPLVDRQVGDRWVLAYNPIRLMCLAAPVPVAPGATFAYTLRVGAAFPDRNMGPEWLVGDVAGTYRLRWLVEERGRAAQVVSNPFALSVGDGS